MSVPFAVPGRNGRGAAAVTVQQWTGFVATAFLCPLGCVAATTGVLLLAARYAAVEVDLVVYLVPVVVSAVRWGRGAAFVAVVSSAAVTDFLLIQPFYSFVIADPREVVELALFVFVALVTSHLAARLRSHDDTLRRREHEIDNLYEFSRRLAACTTAAELLSAIEDHLSVRLGARARLIQPGDALPGDGEARAPRAVARAAHEMVMAAEPGARLLTCEAGVRWILQPIATSLAGPAVLALALGDAHGWPDDRGGALLQEAAGMLTRIDGAAALAKATLRVETEVLQKALIDTATHELRSPLAAILGSASVLEEVAALREDDKLRALVLGMHHEAERLDTDIRKILDAARIIDSGVRLNTRPTDLADVLAAAVRHRQRRTAAHPITVAIAPDLPLVALDAVLIEQAVGQLVENAAKYSPAGSPITVAARVEGGHAVVSVTDTGLGLTPEEADNLFRRAWRGRRHAGRVPGLGLGLWIARNFVAANGGTLTAHSEGPDQGTTMSIRLPLAAPARRIEGTQFEPV